MILGPQVVGTTMHFVKTQHKPRIEHSNKNDVKTGGMSAPRERLVAGDGDKEAPSDNLHNGHELNYI